MSQIDVCYLRDSEGCDLESCADCGYHKLVVESANSLQQLKAEIAVIVQVAEGFQKMACPDSTLVALIIKDLRQLSAV